MVNYGEYVHDIVKIIEINVFLSNWQLFIIINRPEVSPLSEDTAQGHKTWKSSREQQLCTQGIVMLNKFYGWHSIVESEWVEVVLQLKATDSASYYTVLSRNWIIFRYAILALLELRNRISLSTWLRKWWLNTIGLLKYWWEHATILLQ